jgi:acetyl esterase
VPLDPCFAALLADKRIHLRPPTPPVTLADLRNGANEFMRAAAGPEIARVEPVGFDGSDGRRIAGRAYRAVPADVRPAILFLHGGGFVFGNLDTHDAMCRTLAASSGCTVLAVDYRLAPEHPFPAAMNDATDALRQLGRTPEAFGVRAGPIGIAADSAGANVAVGAMGATIDGSSRTGTGPPPAVTIAHAAFLYPVVDPRCRSASMQALARGYMLTRDAMQWFWDCYVPRVEDRADPRVDVLAGDLARLPTTTVVTAEYDPLRDEGEALAQRLDAAGVRVRYECAAGMIHGFAGMPQLTPVADAVVARLGRELGRALGADPPGRENA